MNTNIDASLFKLQQLLLRYSIMPSRRVPNILNKEGFVFV